jgi:hypothetical protein
VQKAGEQIKNDDYLTAQATLQGVKERLQKAVIAIEAVNGSQSQRRRR